MGLHVLYEYSAPGLRAAFRNPAWPGGRVQIGLQGSEYLRHWTSGNPGLDIDCGIRFLLLPMHGRRIGADGGIGSGIRWFSWSVT